MRVAITGSSGFLGSAVARRLIERGDEVLRILREGHVAAGVDGWGAADQLIRALEGTVALVLTGAADGRSDDPDSADRLVAGNIALPARLMAAAAAASCPRVVLIGSSWQEVGGDGYRPYDLYAATKEAAADVAEHYARCGVEIVQLLMFDTYGPGDQRRKIVNLMMEAATRGEELGMSPGDQRMHLVHISDAAASVMAAIDTPGLGAGGTVARYRVDSDAAVTLREVVGVIQELGAPLRVRFGARPYRAGEIMEPLCRFDRIPGWQPVRSLRDGLAECWGERSAAG